MGISPGKKLGPYEIVSPLGAGGMGEVYRALDPRLGREVAIKVLPTEFSEDASRLKRFEKEARSASALNHPNIVTIYDIGAQDGVSYIAMEKVEGSSLRELLVPGAIPLRKLFPIATQIAEGLAKAHEAGIVHRDLKPENVMVTKDGLVKILDFGLAKLTGPLSGSGEGSLMPTMTGTSPGLVVGTAAYMSPEQASGEAVGFASDQFSFGSILYEMVTGRRAFQRKTGIDTLSAILNDDPEPIATVSPQTPAPLRWVVARCHAKDPEGRYASTRDLARELTTLRDHLSEVSSGGLAPVARGRRRLWPWIAAAAAGLAVAAAAYVFGIRKGDMPPPSFQQLTFRRGEIYSARFAPDGESFLYTAAWDGRPMEIFVGRTQSADARPFGLTDTELLAISKSGELAVLPERSKSDLLFGTGTLAQVSIGGGVAPRDILENVRWADWAPDGKSLAVIFDGVRLEYPPGKVLFQAPVNGSLSHPRISPDGHSVAFVEHPNEGDTAGRIALVNRDGGKKDLTGLFLAATGLAWSPEGDIWFTATAFDDAAHGRGDRILYAVRPGGAARRRAANPGSLTLHDISKHGRLLVTRDTARGELWVRAPGDSRERDITWLDWSVLRGVSSDGASILFNAPWGQFIPPPGNAEDPMSYYSVYLRKLDGSAPTRIAQGAALSLSPDGKWVLGGSAVGEKVQLIAYPTGAGQPRPLPLDGLFPYNVKFLPDSRRFLFWTETQGQTRVYMSDIDGKKPVAVTPEGYGGGHGANMIWPDGTRFLTRGPDGKQYLYPIEGGQPQPIGDAGLVDPRDGLAGVAPDGRAVFVHRVGPPPTEVFRADLQTGKRELVLTVKPADLAGVTEIGALRLIRGTDSYAYNLNRTLSDLYVIEVTP